MKLRFNISEEQRLIEWIIKLVCSPFEWVGRALLKALRAAWQDRKINHQSEHKEAAPVPAGPFIPARKHQLGDLLVWVPRRIDSYLIDDLTGGYGYSHVTVDTGENDLITGKPVMVEITVGQVVKRAFQDEFGRRDFARIPLRKTGVSPQPFVECVKSKLGEAYDNWDVLTLGKVQNPAKEVCSGLAADCLPEEHRRRIGRARTLGLLRRASVVVHHNPETAEIKEFISPNGFAEYYGAPRGKHLTGPDTLVTNPFLAPRARKKGRLAALLAVMLLVSFSVVFAWQVSRE